MDRNLAVGKAKTYSEEFLYILLRTLKRHLFQKEIFPLYGLYILGKSLG